MILPMKKKYYRSMYSLIKEFHFDLPYSFEEFIEMMSSMKNNYSYIISNPKIVGYLFCSVSPSFNHKTLIVNELVICLAPQIIELFNSVVNFLFQAAYLHGCSQIIILKNNKIGINWHEYIQKNEIHSKVYNCKLTIV